MSNITLTEKDLASRWSVSHRTLQNWRVAKKGPKYIKIEGSSVRYFMVDIIKYEKDHKLVR